MAWLFRHTLLRGENSLLLLEMPPWLDTLLVVFTIAAAVSYALLRAIRRWRTSESLCHRACGCDLATKKEPIGKRRLIRSAQLLPAGFGAHSVRDDTQTSPETLC